MVAAKSISCGFELCREHRDRFNSGKTLCAVSTFYCMEAKRLELVLHSNLHEVVIKLIMPSNISYDCVV